MWNFRIVKKLDGENQSFGIHEVHYDEYGVPKSVTENPISFFTETYHGLQWNLDRITEAFDKPVLDYDSIVKEK